MAPVPAAAATSRTIFHAASLVPEGTIAVTSSRSNVAAGHAMVASGAPQFPAPAQSTAGIPTAPAHIWTLAGSHGAQTASSPTYSVSLVSKTSGTSRETDLGDQFVPDPQVAVSRNYIVEVVNSGTMTIISRTTPSTTTTISLASFWSCCSGNPPSPAPDDTRILYDPLSDRFFITGMWFTNSPASSTVHVAASNSNNPGGTWSRWQFTAQSSDPIHDQPKIAVTSDKAIVTWNDYTGQKLYDLQEVWAIQKTDLVNGASSPAVSEQNYTTLKYFNVIPATLTETQTASPAYLVFYFASTAPFEGVLTISGTPSPGPVSSVENDVQLPSGISKPPAAQQQQLPGFATAPNFDSGVGSYRSAVVSGSYLWAVGADACTPPGDTQSRACWRLTGLHTATLTAYLDGDIIAGNQGYLTYPAVTLDQNLNVFITGTESSATMFAAAVTAVMPNASPGNYPNLVGYSTGVVQFNCMCEPPETANRFGDYSGIALDFANWNDVFVVAEVGSGDLLNEADWSTDIAAVTLTSTG